MDNATRLGVANAFADRNGPPPDLRMGEWHLGRALRRRIPDGIAADPASPVTQTLGPAFYTPARWRAFVAAVEHEHDAGTHGPLTGLLRWIDDYGELIERQAATRHPTVPNSTSPVEAPLAEIKRRLEDRAGVFTNLARMNKLLVLMALDLRGQTDGRAWADRLREHTYLAAGRAPEQRPHDDPQPVVSLTA